MRLNSSQIRQSIQEIEIYGFTILNEFMSHHEVLELREAVRLLELHPWPVPVGPPAEGNGFKAGDEGLLDTVLKDLRLLRTIAHEEVLSVVRHFLGRETILAGQNVRIVRPGEAEQALHSDIPEPLFRPGSPLMMQTAWMLDDFTESNGATRLVPGSHLSRYPGPPEGFSPRYEVKALGKAGSLLIFNGQCWHGSGANRTEQKRYALFNQYRVGGWMSFQWKTPDLEAAEPFRNELTETEKKLLRIP